MVETAVAVAENTPILEAEFVQEMLKQLRALDTYDVYEKASPIEILSPLVLTKERKAEIPIVGDPDEETLSRVKAYYNALSFLIEKRSGLMAVPFINISHEGFGRALITVGKLVVVDKVLRDVHRFGFKSLEKMNDEAEKMVTNAVTLVEKYREVAES